MDPLSTGRLLTEYWEAAQKAGITISYVEDLRELNGLALVDKKVSAMFDPSRSEIAPHDTFWLKGTDPAGDIVHVQAARCDDTGRGSLAELISRRLEVLYQSEPAVTHGELLDEVTGRCVYHGDGWIAPHYRDNGLGEMIYKLGTLAILLRFNPDYVYAFFEEPLMRSGFPVRCWYEKMERVGQHFHTWLLPTDYVACVSAEDLANAVALEADRNARPDRQR